MKTILAVAALSLAITACSSDTTGPGATPPPDTTTVTIHPEGAYVLSSIGGASLPTDLVPDASLPADCSKRAGHFCVTKGSITVSSSGAYSSTFDWIRYYPSGAVDQVGTVGEAGKWKVSAGAVVFSPDGQPTYGGSVLPNGDLKTSAWGGLTFKKTT